MRSSGTVDNVVSSAEVGLLHSSVIDPVLAPVFIIIIAINLFFYSLLRFIFCQWLNDSSFLTLYLFRPVKSRKSLYRILLFALCLPFFYILYVVCNIDHLWCSNRFLSYNIYFSVVTLSMILLCYLCCPVISGSYLTINCQISGLLSLMYWCHFPSYAFLNFIHFISELCTWQYTAGIPLITNVKLVSYFQVYSIA